MHIHRIDGDLIAIDVDSRKLLFLISIFFTKETDIT